MCHLLHAISAVEPRSGLVGSGGFGWMLLETVLLLAAVCLLAYVVIRLLHRRLYGADRSGGRGRRQLEVVDRLALGPRRSIQVVRAGSKMLLVGVSENRIDLIDELNPDDWPDDWYEKRLDNPDTAVQGAFKRTLREVLARRNEPSAEPAAEETAEETEGRGS